MNFAQVGHELVSHPIASLAAVAGVALVARTAIKAGIRKYRAHKVERDQVKAILAESANAPVPRVQMPAGPH